MKFDPTKDYYGLDLSVELNHLLWNYWEFIKMLVTLSSPADKQREIMGFGAVADEMAVDFDFYYSVNVERFAQQGLLTNVQIAELNLIDKFLENRSGKHMPKFWQNTALDTHPDWQEIRQMTHDVLVDLKYDNLKIEIERAAVKTKSNLGRTLVMQSTKTCLIQK